MPLTFTPTSIPDVIVVAPDAYADPRGYFTETYHAEKYRDGGIASTFVQDNRSHSAQYVVRGLHYQYQHAQAKLVYVVQGEILDVALDIRRGSPTFGQWTAAVLSAENHQQLFIPEGFAHGFSVLSETADVAYKCSDLYAPGDEFGILWNDPALAIDWRIDPANAIVADKDNACPRLADVPGEQLPIVKKRA